MRDARPTFRLGVDTGTGTGASDTRLRDRLLVAHGAAPLGLGLRSGDRARRRRDEHALDAIVFSIREEVVAVDRVFERQAVADDALRVDAPCSECARAIEACNACRLAWFVRIVRPLFMAVPMSTAL